MARRIYRCLDRITPAYAGKRIIGSFSTPNGKDHPRLRGEKFDIIGRYLFGLGSPPLTRGKAQEQKRSHKAKRITPAYAGKSLFLHLLRLSIRDHPRLRGEKSACLLLVAFVTGSPPLTRGKVINFIDCRDNERITPAYAGKSAIVRWYKMSTKDHPRLRGEKEVSGFPPEDPAGSPPLTRGKELVFWNRWINWGITPAYAGKSIVIRECPEFEGDHPRLRGEKVSLISFIPLITGSPPLTRGKGLLKPQTKREARITPAYAGKSFVSAIVEVPRGDHPRLRGEKTKHSCKTQPYHMLLSGFLLHFIRYSTASFQLFV